MQINHRNWFRLHNPPEDEVPISLSVSYKKLKSVFEQATRYELINRIHLLNDDTVPQWGEMNVCQMIKHCILAEEMYLGKKQYERKLVGRLFGKTVLRETLQDDKPMRRHAPAPEYLIVDVMHGDMETEKARWIAMLDEYGKFEQRGIVHWFFGEMSQEQIGQFVYKHIDHHLRQFNC